MVTILALGAAGLGLWSSSAGRIPTRAGRSGRWWLIPALAGAVLVATRSLALVLAVLVLLPAVSTVTRGVLAHRRRACLQEEISRALRLVHGNVRAGALLGDAITSASAQVADPDLQGELSLGAQAPWGALPGAGAHTVALAVEAATRYGIGVEGLLRHAIAAEEMDRAHREATGANLQGAVTSAAMLAALPLGGIGLAQFMGVDALGFLLGTAAGAVALVLGAVCEATGIWWSYRIIQAVAL